MPGITDIVIPERFNGPSGHAGGGYVSGLLAEQSGGRSDTVAAPWTPGHDLATDGVVAPRSVWSALDCPGAAAACGEAPRPIRVAQMSGCVEAPIHAGEEIVALGWRIAREGRKHFGGTALLDPGGAILARSRQLRVEPRNAC